jgi:hypothetical protein
MANVSPQRDAIVDLINRAKPERGQEFDPFNVTHLEGIGNIYLRRTVSFPAIPKIGNFCVAVFDLNGKVPALTVEDEQDMVRHRVDGGVLLARADQLPWTNDHDRELERLSHPAARVLRFVVPPIDAKNPTVITVTDTEVSYPTTVVC